MRLLKRAACFCVAAAMLLSLGLIPRFQAENVEFRPQTVYSKAENTAFYAYIPDHSIYFFDADSDYRWAFPSIDYLANGGVVAGDGNHLFYPGRAITRADFLIMLYRAYDMSQYAGGASFSDVAPNAYYADAVSAAKTLGIASGANGKFRPTEPMTRQDAMVFLKRTLDLTGVRFVPGDLSGFQDADAVAPYAADAVAALVQAGVVSGNGGRLNPKSSITRAEMAVMLYRALHLTADGVYTPDNARVNLCIGDTMHTDVRIENYDPETTYTGLFSCYNFSRTEEGYFVSLGAPAAFDQQIGYENGVLTVDGEEMPLAPDAIAIDTAQYSTLADFVPTGETYTAARVSVLDGLVTAVYYTAE